jgi:hypothetical protein
MENDKAEQTPQQQFASNVVVGLDNASSYKHDHQPAR